MTKAIQFEHTGGPEVLSLNEIPTPHAGPGEVVVRTEAIGVNPLEWKLRSGIRPLPPFDGPRGMGADGAGVVVEVGEGAEGTRVGQQVAFADAKAAYATEVVVNARSVTPRPADVSLEAAAALGIPAGTAYQVVRSMAIGAGDVVLVNGGSGSVGQALIQFARILGATVIATSSPARFDQVRALGAIPVAYGPGLAERVREEAPSPVTVAIDCAGTDEAIETSIELVPDRQRVATIVRGPDADGWGIRAFSGGSPRPLTEQELVWRREAVPLALSLMAVGAFQVELGKAYPLAEAGQAQADSQAGAPGKLILHP